MSGIPIWVRDVLAHYPDPLRPRQVEFPEESAGFSGARVIRVETAEGAYCLRGWPPGDLPRDRLLGLHRLLEWVFEQGVSQVAVPVLTLDQSTLATVDDRLWQLEPWKPGSAGFHQNPSPQRLDAAMICLANWHRAAASFRSTAVESAWFACHSGAASPAVCERLDLIRRWSERRLDQLSQRMRADAQMEFRDAAEQVLISFRRCAPTVTTQLQAASEMRFTLQPCLRDCWHDHVLFQGEKVTGLIDASACRTENVVTDLARLVGSFAGDDRDMWRLAIQAYSVRRPLSSEELDLLQILDRSGVLLSGMTWLDRYYLQGEAFPRMDRVVQRLRGISQRLGVLATTI